MDKIKDKLLKYQIQHTENLVRILQDNKACLDASDTGTGKTYSAIAACAILGLNPIIICPKTIKNTWKSVCEYFNVIPEIIVNYEALKSGNTYEDLTVTEDPKTNKTNFEFKPKSGTIFIFDEAHRCANLDTENCRILFAAKHDQIFFCPPKLLALMIQSK